MESSMQKNMKRFEGQWGLRNSILPECGERGTGIRPDRGTPWAYLHGAPLIDQKFTDNKQNEYSVRIQTN
jgi:hypothetical protein